MKKNKRLIAKIFNVTKLIMTIDRNMLSCEFGALDRGNLTDVVNWGIYANRGSISFIDNIGYFNNKNVNSTDIKNYIVKFYLAKNQETLIAAFKVDTVDFDDETRRVDIQLIGRANGLQNSPSTNKKGDEGDVFTFSNRSAAYLAGFDPPEGVDQSVIYKYYEEYRPNLLTEEGVDTVDLHSAVIYCPYLKFGTLWDKMTKICQATMCRIFDNEDGKLSITGERPRRTPIIVKPKNIISISKSQFVKVSNASIELTKREKYTSTNIESVDRTVTFNYVFNDSNIDLHKKPISISNVGSYSIEKNLDQYVIKFGWKTKLNFKTHKIRSINRTINLSDGSSITSSVSIINCLIDGYDTLMFSDEVRYSAATGGTKPLTISYSFYLDYFEDEGHETLTLKKDDSGEEIGSNDFIQTESYYEDGIKNPKLGEHILNEVVRRYGKGRECFEIECLFNDYYDVDRNKVCDTNDLSTHFKKYDIIIPYVMKKGNIVPLRINEDGTPKQFRIIGISYSYDGLLKQKLSIQEDRYDVD